METIKKRQKRGPRGLVSALVKSLIIRNELTDKEICERIKERFPDASTSVKCVQYYRYQLRTAGKIPPAKVNRRQERTILMWELIPGPKACYTEGFPGHDESLEGQYTGKQLMTLCRKIYMNLTEVDKHQANEKIYSVPVCVLLLHKLGWECIEFQHTIKVNEYVKEEN